LLAGSQPSALDPGPNPAVTVKAGQRGLAVCHIASGDRWAGAEVQLATLLRALARRTDLRVSAILLNEGRLANEARQCGIDICVLPESQYSVFQIALRAGHFLRGRNVHVLHSHRYKENILAAALARRHHIPVQVCSCHGAAEPFSGWRRYKQGAIEVVDRFVVQHFMDCVVSVSEDLRTQLSQYLPEHKIVTVHNGIDLKKVFSPLSVSQAKERLGIPAKSWVIGTVGRLDPIKRLDLFLAAAQEIVIAQPDTRFVIAGEGKEDSRLRNLAANLGLRERVSFLGHREDVY
jgi:L-malate glycosyltransferase